MKPLRFVCFFFIFYACVPLAWSITEIGTCPRYTPMRNFKPEGYLGKWFLNEKFATILEQISYNCQMFFHTKTSDPSTISLLYRSNDVNAGPKTLSGTITFVTNPSVASMFLHFPTLAGNNLSDGKPNYNVLETDYTSFAIAYNCKYFLGVRNEELWILTREKNPSEAFLTEVRLRVRNLGLDVFKLSRMSTQGC